jgi:hypothetical protein
MRDIETTPLARQTRTLWKPGEGGNPAGAEGKLRARVLHYARGKSLKAMKYLAKVIDDETASHAVRTTASIALLDRAWGKPQQSVEVESRGSSLEELLIALHAARTTIIEPQREDLLLMGSDVTRIEPDPEACDDDMGP